MLIDPFNCVLIVIFIWKIDLHFVDNNMTISLPPWYISLYYFLLNGSYPKDADSKVCRKIRYHCSKLMSAKDGRLLEVNSGRELLHKGIALQKV